MKLLIISPETRQEHDVAWVEINTKAGNFIILAEHAPMVATLTENQDVTFCFEDGKQETINPTGGTAEVTRSAVKLLLNSAP